MRVRAQPPMDALAAGLPHLRRSLPAAAAGHMLSLYLARCPSTPLAASDSRAARKLGSEALLSPSTTQWVRPGRVRSRLPARRGAQSSSSSAPPVARIWRRVRVGRTVAGPVARGVRCCRGKGKRGRGFSLPQLGGRRSSPQPAQQARERQRTSEPALIATAQPSPSVRARVQQRLPPPQGSSAFARAPAPQQPPRPQSG